MRRVIAVGLGIFLAGVTGAAQQPPKAPPAAAGRPAAAHVTTPKEEFGHNFGDDYFLANYQQISA